MNKRIIFITLSLSLLAILLVACGGSTQDREATDAEHNEQITAEGGTSAEGGTTAEAGAAAEAEVSEAAVSETAVSETGDSEADPERDSGTDSTTNSQGETEVSQSYAGKVAAPEFPVGVDWLNTAGPLTLADLRGKVILLDFWTYGCINCIHIIPDLIRLEEKYGDELVVIGVHSAKFENEGDTDNIRNIVLRYELKHPIINDNEFQVWTEYGARAWPTLVLIDPEGKVLGYHSGEGIFGLFDEVIGGMIAEFDALGRIDRTPLELKLEQENQNNSPLLFPGKVLADEENNRLFIADSNHNRIVVSDLEGNVLEVIGDGQARLQDGDSQSASFFRPQGLSLADENTLYVADTENHVIRRIDLAAGEVETVAGTGEQVYNLGRGGPALSTPLNSPWDVLYHDGELFIAMAGQHQVWMYDPAGETLRLHAGSGREELRDGKLVEGGLNQPSGLATDGQVLYIADSEASAIRTADIDPDGQLETIVGTGLFDFGDVDGQGDDVRLQHPLGVVVRDDLLYVADTYNSKIKIVDPAGQTSETFLGGSESGWRDGSEALFDEPGGLSFGGDRLYIADTNNHVVRVADLATGEVSTLVLVDMEGYLTRQPAGSDYNGLTATLPAQTVGAGEGTIRLEVTIPEGYKVNDLAPFSMEWVSSDPAVTVKSDESSQTIVEPHFPLSLTTDFSPGDAELTGELVIYYCEEESQSLCLIERVRVSAPITVTDSAGDGGENTVVVSHVIADPE